MELVNGHAKGDESASGVNTQVKGWILIFMKKKRNISKVCKLKNSSLKKIFYVKHFFFEIRRFFISVTI